ncbi:unnamed protein product [Arabidopsis lyrata]|nr:unnamed protein product [Arabidopsis lyrata]
MRSSPSNSSNMGRNWMFVEFVALVLWNLELAHSISMGLDTFVSTFVLSCSTLIALMRSLTAVCRFCLDLAWIEIVSWQLRLRSLFQFNRPVDRVHRSFHSSHLSFMELFILLTTSLVFSGSVTRSIVIKTVLLDAEAKIVVHDYSRSAFAGCLALSTREALFPPLCCLEVFKFHVAGRASCLCSLGWTFTSYDCTITASFSAIGAFVASALVAEALALCSALLSAAG